MSDDFHTPGNAKHQLGFLLRNAELVLGAPRKCVPRKVPPMENTPRVKTSGWYTRGYLPHYDKAGAYQMITYRLADSLPKVVLQQMEDELTKLPADKRDSARRERIENWLDAGHGSCVLRCPEAAQCVVETWQHFDSSRYELVAGVVMPNHVHVLICVYEGVTLGKIVQSWKSYTGRRIAEMMEKGRTGARRSQKMRSREVWMREYWDRFIRDENHFANAVEYIHNNPVKAKLVKKTTDWYWSSAGDWGKSPVAPSPNLPVIKEK